MATQRALLKGSTGLNTVVDPVRIPYDWRTGISDLAVAINVTLDPSGRINRRKGYDLKIALSNCHSLFCDGGEAVFVRASNLYLLESDHTYRLLTALSNNRHMAYAQVGNRIYYTNNQDYGYIENGIKCTWSKATDYVGPTTYKTFVGPFAGNHLAFWKGRMYISKDNNLWWSQYLAVDWYDKARNWQYFNTHIRMVKPVMGGLYVSTEKAIYYLGGENPKQFEKIKKTTYPALEWSDAIDYVNGEDIPNLGFVGPCALWVTTEGAMIGSPNGEIKNLNRDKVVYPKGTKGASLLRGLNFIHTIE